MSWHVLGCQMERVAIFSAQFQKNLTRQGMKRNHLMLKSPWIILLNWARHWLSPDQKTVILEPKQSLNIFNATLTRKVQRELKNLQSLAWRKICFHFTALKTSLNRLMTVETDTRPRKTYWTFRRAFQMPNSLCFFSYNLRQSTKTRECFEGILYNCTKWCLFFPIENTMDITNKLSSHKSTGTLNYHPPLINSKCLKTHQ